MRGTPDCRRCDRPEEDRRGEYCADCKAVCADMAYDEMKERDI